MRSINYQLAAFRRLQVVCHFPQGLQSALILHAHEKITTREEDDTWRRKERKQGTKDYAQLVPWVQEDFHG